jgi:hypothetical protein
MTAPTLPSSAQLKIELMFDGIRYSDSLGAAAEHAFPNFYPYRFRPGEPNPTGNDKVTIPYLMTLPDETLIRVKGTADAPWQVMGDALSGYRLRHDDGRELPVAFAPLPHWMREQTSDGLPMAQAGVSLHGDMAIINIAPGCEYFLNRGDNGDSLRCTFCAYGAPNERIKHYEQRIEQAELSPVAIQRMQETLRAALDEGGIRHLYLVGGSMKDWSLEGDRYLALAQAVQQVNGHRVPVSCGSGALPADRLERLQGEGLVDQVCFNLEVWSAPLFAKVCPGKARFVGYERWLQALDQAVALWGKGRVYSAMVAGIELEPEHEMGWDEAASLAIEGADKLCERGVLPVYSLYWPTGGRDHPDYFDRLHHYFERLNIDYAAIRRQRGLKISSDFMCHCCAYMQLECDIDRGVKEPIDD